VRWYLRSSHYQDAGMHRRADHRTRRRDRVVEMVDARTLTAHLLTDAALAAGRHGEGRYVALCGADVLPASLTAPERAYCTSCVLVPEQRLKVP
jgi:hypothetical protein